MYITLIDPSGQRQVALDDITEVVYNPSVSFIGAERASVHLAAKDAKGLLQLIRFATPFQPGGTPLALVTETLVLTFTTEG